MAMRSETLTLVIAAFAVWSSDPLPAAAQDLQSQLLAIYKNPATAQAGFNQLILSGDPKTTAVIGVMLFDGVGVPIDHRNALPFLEKAAEAGRADAQYRLGIAYTDGANPNIYKDPPPDAKIADGWFTKAAASAMAAAPNDAAAMTTLAELKNRGRGGVAVDLSGALTLVAAASDMGYPQAEILYGWHWSADLSSPDPAKQAQAEFWFGKAMAVGASEAFEGMGMMYIEGPNPILGLPYLRRAAKMGQEPASRFLYLRFGEKIGDNLALEQDKVFEKESGAWLHKAVPDVATATSEEFSDPVNIALAIVAMSAIIGIAFADPNAPGGNDFEQNEADMEAMDRATALVMCVDPDDGSSYLSNGQCW
ncbi:MAG: tetratricopeptide repeat protein [Cypionkella sp.]